MAAGDPRGYYEILGIRRTASAEEIRSAFRQRAKQYHPDRGGSAEDEARFRRLREAFETLRDPQQRVRYDAEALASEQRRNGMGMGARSGRAAPRPPEPAPWWTHPLVTALRRRLQQPETRAALRRLASVWTPLLVMVLLSGLVLQRLGSQERTIIALSQRLDGALAALAQPDPPLAAPLADDAVVFRAELLFARGSAELGPAHRARIDATLGELRRAIARLPANDGWGVVIAGQARGVLDPGTGSMEGAWGLTLRRLGAAADYLVRQGVPAERLAARFHAGNLQAGDAPSVPEALQLTLFCCGEGSVAQAQP